MMLRVTDGDDNNCYYKLILWIKLFHCITNNNNLVKIKIAKLKYFP